MGFLCQPDAPHWASLPPPLHQVLGILCRSDGAHRPAGHHRLHTACHGVPASGCRMEGVAGVVRVRGVQGRCTTRSLQVGYLGGRPGIDEYMGAGPFHFRIHTRWGAWGGFQSAWGERAGLATDHDARPACCSCRPPDTSTHALRTYSCRTWGTPRGAACCSCCSRGSPSTTTASASA